MRTITYYLATNQVIESDTIYPNAFSADDNTTQLIFDFTGTACATWDKWLDLTMSDYTKDVQSLGTGTIVTFNLGAEHTKKGLLQVNPYAKNGTDKHGFPIYKLTIERQLNNSTVDASAQQSMIDYFDDRLTVKAVSATTLAPGESATASVTTEADGTTYVFGIPQGATGAQGLKGDKGDKGAQWRGAYSAGTAYVIDDVVSYNGSSYICILASTGNLPTDPTYWLLIASKGDTGATGATGATGVQGIQGQQGTNMVVKGVYATTTALNAALPTGDTGIAIVTADGHWYYWSGSAWVDGGVYQATGITDGSIGMEKLSFYAIDGTPSKNLFNKDTATLGEFYFGSTGVKATNPDYYYSALIPVTGGEQYSIQHAALYCWYDSSQVFISGVDFYYDEPATVTAPATAAFLRVSAHIVNIDLQMVVLGATLGSYEPYTNYVGIENLSPEIQAAIAKQTLADVFARVKLGTATQIKLLGDSITAGVAGTGFDQLGNLIITVGADSWYVNVGGYCWANELKAYVEEKFPNTIVKNYGTSGVSSSWLKYYLGSLVEAADDIVIIMIGTNDSYLGTPLYQNLVDIVNTLQSQGKVVVLMSSVPFIQSGTLPYYMEDVDLYISKVADYFNMEYISLYRDVFRYCENKGVSISTLISPDAIHPNDAGYKVMFGYICDHLGIARRLSLM